MGARVNGLDLFSGIGGIGLALSCWVRTVAYCEADRYAQAVLLSRMESGEIDRAPIWDDVRTLRGDMLPRIDIIFTGFPCQDISVAGLGKGLEGERSGLFFEIVRLVDEIRPTFIFLENVAAITNRGLEKIATEVTKRGYDCRWTTLSAAEVGANHKRNRWWLLGYSKHNGLLATEERGSTEKAISDNSQRQKETSKLKRTDSSTVLARKLEQRYALSTAWWGVEPDVGRVVNGLPHRVDRIKCLGNSVVPLCAKEAFKELVGFYNV
jgi:DNA (cytosine-5)-methyltransferase 1